MNTAPKYRRRRRVAVAIIATALGAGLWSQGATPDSPKCNTHQTTKECHQP